MFFYLSKIFWLLVQPVNLTGLLLLAAIVAQVVRWRRLAITASLGAFVVLGVSAWTSLGALMLHPLEDRFARPAALPETVDGIIVLGDSRRGGQLSLIGQAAAWPDTVSRSKICHRCN